MTFDEAFLRLMKYEGGYVDHAADPGGKTNWGITQAVASAHGYTGSMQAMPRATANAIYRTTYWDAMQCDALPSDVRFVVFDAAVNSGCAQAAKWLQRAVGTTEDGILGPKTMAAIMAQPGYVTAARLSALRLLFLTQLNTWPSFGKGWVRRVADNLLLGDVA